VDAPAPVSIPTDNVDEVPPNDGFGDDNSADDGFGDDNSADDKPFDDTPFDAGVEANEETDPKKFIEQLTGKLGQSLRAYTESQGQPDFDLEKFAINSVLSATNTGDMDDNDQGDIIKKVKSSGKGNTNDGDQSGSDDNTDNSNGSDEFGDSDDMDEFGDSEFESVNESTKDEDEVDGIMLSNPKKNNMFQPNSNDILKTTDNLTESKKRRIFVKKDILSKLNENFKLDEDMELETEVEPIVEPTIKPSPTIKPNRTNKPFILPTTLPMTPPKASK